MGDATIADVSSAESTEPRHFHLADESAFRLHSLGKTDGLILKTLPNGCLYSIEQGEIFINQVLASPLAGGIHRIYLRVLQNGIFQFAEIVGPASESVFTTTAGSFSWRGLWAGLSYHCHCRIDPLDSSWTFQVDVQNSSEKPVNCDAIAVQDIGLATRGHIRNNERFTSQYLDHLAIPHPELGHLLLTRQNLPQPNNTHPWLMQACLPRMEGFTTDGFDFFGLNFKETAEPEALQRAVIGNQIRQYEAGYSAIQSNRAQLQPGDSQRWCFFSRFSPDHPAASSAADIDDAWIRRAQESCKSMALGALDLLLPTRSKQRRSLFQTAPLLSAEDFTESEIRSEFPGDFRHEEFAEGKRQSFFYGNDSRHVVLKAKETALPRSHGHIMRSGPDLMPDGEVMSSAFYAPGVFAAQMAVGNTVFGKFLTGVRDPLNIIPSSGLRMFVRRPRGAWQLLAVPSAFEMAPNFCRWHYKFEGELLTVTCVASDEDPAFSYSIQSRENPLELLICGEISAGPQEYDFAPRMTIDVRRARITIRPDARSLLAQKQPEISFHVVSATPHAIEAIGGDELIGPAGKSPTLPCFAIRTHPINQFSLGFIGTFDDIVRTESLCAKYETTNGKTPNHHIEPSPFWDGTSGKLRIFSKNSPRASQVQDTLAWMARDAMVHFSIPRGLEQANGGAWGVRDVCQGPVEFFLAHDRWDLIREILLELFSQQYRQRGDWPQWFMFPPFQQVQARDAQGDVVIWPLKALCDYLEQTDDGQILREPLPYTDDETFDRVGPSETIVEHADRLLACIRETCLPGTSLPCYGDGDWDDSLQPASEDLAEHMVSSWTVALLFQTLRRYAVALCRFGEDRRAAEVSAFAQNLRQDYQQYLIPDGIVAGFAVFKTKSSEIDSYMLHPRDQRTGLRYRLISMTRGILSGIFCADQASHHLELIEKHLLYPDGARLIDRPTTYGGGLEKIFRRSESAAFFGREIGLQYVHAHLRYAEALATMGRPRELLHALSVVNPISVTDAVVSALPRQRNAYFSSSDAAFRDRYEASRDYDKLRNGKVAVDGGWRIYSSGPGIYTNLVVRHLLGIRNYFDCIDFDPVLPAELNGLRCELDHRGRKVRYEFRQTGDNGSQKRILINGIAPKAMAQPEGQYRPGGIRLKRADFETALDLAENKVQIES